MKKAILTLIVANTATIGLAQSEENYGSLVPKSYKPAFSTRTARKVGDVLTVIISESSSGQYQADTTATKKDANNVNKSSVPLVDFLKVGLLETLTRAQSTGADSSVAGAGSTGTSGRLTARMAVVIKQVLANGSFVVEGTRAMKINRETQQMTLSGICRLDDIRTDNTLLSENLANAEIKSEGMGMIFERQRKGFITKILDWLF